MSKKKSIMRKWLANTLGIVSVFLLVFSIIILFLFKDYYYSAVDQILVSNIENLNSYFQIKLTQTDSISNSVAFDNMARELIEIHDKKETTELQILDLEGHIIISSTGFELGDTENYHFEKIERNVDEKKVWVGKNSSGENISVVTGAMYSADGTIYGYARMISSLGKINRQIFKFGLLILLVGVIVILFVLISSSYFVNSIIKPVTDINKTARRIALGDYDARIEKRSNDEIGELCDTINFMAKEISQTADMKNDFISSISHEIRTPLTAIKGWSETLKSIGTSDEVFTQKGLDVITSEVERLSKIVEELLDFSRMQSGYISLKMDYVDITAELSEAVLLYEEKARRQGVEIVYLEPENLPPVVGDKDRLKQVFINIIDNSVKYTPEGGKIRIETAEMDKQIQIVVSDTGVGIPKGEIPNIKEKFYRVNRTQPGSGIGLALADDIVKRHKGRLDIDSEEGKGTTVTIMLSVAPSDAE